jgi:hypothetical protein
MLDRAVLIHLKLIDLPRQAAARKVLDDDTLRFANSCLPLQRNTPNRRGARECSNLLTTQKRFLADNLC